jgi:hypothetical protein
VPRARTLPQHDDAIGVVVDRCLLVEDQLVVARQAQAVFLPLVLAG